VGRYPLSEVEAVFLATGAASVSVRFLVEASRRGLPVYIVDSRGSEVGVVLPGVGSRTTAKSVAQAEWRVDPVRRLRVAKWFILGKVRSRAWLLKRLSRYMDPRLRDAGFLLDASVHRVYEASSVDELRLVEAELGRRYWGALSEFTGLGERGFRGRRPRGGDEWNTILDYLYALLRGLVHRELYLAGLNPYMGFMHVDRSGRPSLSLDFMEPYRFAVEWVVARLAGRGLEGVEAILEGDGRLSREARRLLLREWVSLLDSRYPGSQYSLEGVVRRDSWRFGEALVEYGEYTPTLPSGW
jgi:CRISPR-associated protein Cas1